MTFKELKYLIDLHKAEGWENKEIYIIDQFGYAQMTEKLYENEKGDLILSTD